MDDTCVELFGFDIQPGESDGELKSARPGTPGFRNNTPRLLLDERFVRMSKDDCRHASGLGIEIELIHIVEHVNAVTAEIDQLRWR